MKSSVVRILLLAAVLFGGGSSAFAFSSLTSVTAIFWTSVYEINSSLETKCWFSIFPCHVFIFLSINKGETVKQDNSNIGSEFVFQQTLITKLQKLGIRCASEFRIPARKGEEFRVDLMITFPIRAIIEIKNFRNKATTNKSLNPLIDTFNAINKRYFGTLRFFLIDLSGQKNLPLDPTKNGIHFIKIPEREQDGASYCAKEIKNRIFQQELKLNQADSTHLMPSNLDPAYFDLFKINVSKFEEVLISLSAYIKPEEYKMVVEEVSELNSEIISKH